MLQTPDSSKVSVKGPDSRLIISIAAIVALALFFWMGSRYPALNEKAAMGGDTPLSGLSFDIALEIFPGSSIWWELVANTINWVYTNLKGMTFGVLFGAGALTVLSLVKKRSFEGAFSNSALGVVIGAPLGVCVNCAAPIALGLHAGRMRLETTLSALLASPTLNVIVITMSFALLPPHLAALKLVMALILVLLVVPLLCRFILTSETDATRHDPGITARISQERGLTAWIARALMPIDADPRPYGFGEAIVWFIKTYGRNFLFVFIVTVPMMFLAAVLGAVVATFTAPNELASVLPQRGLIAIGLAVVLVAIIASFVPAPIALDVILTVILLGIGLKEHYAMTMLIALGSFSIYAFIILWRAISLKTGLTVWAAVIGMSVASGLAAYFGEPVANRYYFSQQVAAINAVDGLDFETPEDLPPGRTLAELQATLDGQRLQLQPAAADIETSQASQIALSLLSQPSAGQGIESSAATGEGAAFSRIIGPEIGLDEKGIISPVREFGYHIKGGGIAAGDIHGDGWTDVITRRPVLANGLSLYTNVGGRFERQELELGPVDDSEVFHLALADVDGDHRLDLLVSTVRNGEYLFYNEGGSFSTDNMIELFEPEQAVLASVGFADLDSDGDLDIVAGKWAARGVSIGWGLHPLHNRNQIYWNEGNRTFSREVIPHSNGQTLTLLISDLDGDGQLDILDGDDAGQTDAVTFMTADGEIAPHEIDRQPFDYMMISTMGFTQGDWNNDLRTDYYGAQIADQRRASGQRESENRRLLELCSQFSRDLGWDDSERAACARQLLSIDAIKGQQANNKDCSRIADPQDRAICASAELIRSYANRTRSLEPDTARLSDCRNYLDHIPFMQQYCDSLALPVEKRLTREQREALFVPAVAGGNIMMTAQADGQYVDEAQELGVRWPGWSWNARFTDLNQDGWQDILVMTGIWQRTASAATNTFYLNRSGTFSDATDDFGFHDLTPSYSYVQLDYDRDGDIDLVRDNMSLRMIVHRNETPSGPGLWVRLRDEIGNSMGIGAKVTVCTDGVTQVRQGPCQRRIVHASGGYMAADPIMVHFGLGNARAVSLIEVEWPDGEISRVKPAALLGGEVQVSRSR